MKVCPNCQTKYPDDANFCPQETCATPQGPRRLEPIVDGRAGAALRDGRADRRRAQRRGLARARHADRRHRRLQARRARGAADAGRAVERAQRELKQLQRAQSPRIARGARLRQGRRTAGCSSPASSCDGRAARAAWSRATRAAARSIAPRRSSRRSARRCSRGRRSASSTTTSPPKNVLVGGERRGEGDQLRRRRVPVTETGLRRARVPVARAGRRQARRPALEHLQPGRASCCFMLTGQPPVVGRRRRRGPGAGA